MAKESYTPDVKFGGGGTASVAGVFGGVGISVGVPLVLLVYGQVLGQGIQVMLVITAVIGGIVISLIATFFGMVMPSSVHEQWKEKENQPKQ